MTKRNKYDCIVIGAGASGLVATLLLQQKNKKVLLLEKKKQAGLKLRLTGKGRCNLTNTLKLKEFLRQQLNQFNSYYNFTKTRDGVKLCIMKELN